ncbi:LuxR C-terminal-related transcriptional regulator [Tsukamurella sp. USMM236]|uniref:LuxR C-terminal-related transcriptional regulator n=1 Tax=Tsukamurella sp. USMM236 TaxID=3081301 RepID=UPI00301800C1
MDPWSVRRIRGARAAVVGDPTGRGARALATYSRPDAPVVQALGALAPDDGARLREALAAGAGVIVADAQRLDDRELGELAAAAQRGTPVVLARATAEPPVSGLWNDDARALGADVHLALDAFSADEIAALARGLGLELSGAAAVRLHRRTGGAIEATLAALDEAARSGGQPSDAVPAGERHRITAALAEVGEPAAGVALAAAVLGGATPTDLAAVAGTELTAELLDALAAHGLVIARRDRDGPWIAPPAPIVARAVEEASAWTDRARLHAAAAEVVDPHRALRHRAAAVLRSDAALARALADDGGALAARGEWSSAAAAFAAATGVAADAEAARELRIAAVDAYVSAGDLGAARELVPAIEALPASPERDSVLGYVAIQSGRPAEALDRLERAWNAVNPRLNPLPAARIAHRRGLDALVRWDGPALITWADRAIALGGDAPPAIESRAFRGLGAAAAGDVVGAARAVEVGLAETGLPVAVSQRLMLGVGWIQYGLGDLDRARTALTAAREAVGGAHRVSLWALGWLARVQFEIGDWDAALESAREAVELGDSTGIVLCSPLAHWTAAEILALRGDADGADRHAAAARVAPTGYLTQRIPAALAQAAAARGGSRAVLAAVQPLLADPAARTVSSDFWPWHHVAARALADAGRGDEAVALLDGAPAPQSTPARIRLGAARAAADPDADAAADALRDCLAEAESFPVAAGGLHLDLGMLLRRTGHRRDAAHHLGEAAAAFESLGAHARLRTTDRELGRTSGPSAADVATLTPHELNVARLVVAGDTNRRVAEQLYLSPKTVQFHLTRIFAKLGVRTRGELTARYGGELTDRGPAGLGS